MRRRVCEEYGIRAISVGELEARRYRGVSCGANMNEIERSRDDRCVLSDFDIRQWCRKACDVHEIVLLVITLRLHTSLAS